MSRRMFILTRFFDRSSRALSMQLSVPLYCSHFHQGKGGKTMLIKLQTSLKSRSLKSRGGENGNSCFSTIAFFLKVFFCCKNVNLAFEGHQVLGWSNSL